MTNRKFYKLNLKEKIWIATASFTTVITILYFLRDIVLSLYSGSEQPLHWTCYVILALLVLVLGIILTCIVMWIYSVLKEYRNVIDNKSNVNSNDEMKFVSGEGLGEIDFYWGDRIESNYEVKKYLATTKANKIFIAALGFGTIKELKGMEVIDNFANLIKVKNTTFKITIVKPDTAEEFIEFRKGSIKTEAELRQKFTEGNETLKEFEKNLAEKCFPLADNKMELVKQYIEYRKYKTIPRHFILRGDDKVIFFGSYLGSTEGYKSYIMKLVPCSKMPSSKDKYTLGLFNLFEKEVEYILKDENSQKI